MMVFQMYSDQTRMSIDVFVQYPLDFDELWDQGTKIDLPGTSLRIASIDHLILMKRKASRPQDLLDIEQLEKIKRLLDEPGMRPMNRELEPPAGSFEAAELYQLRMALKSTYAQRLQDLQDMLDFNAEAEARNPRLLWTAARLRHRGPRAKRPAMIRDAQGLMDDLAPKRT